MKQAHLSLLLEKYENGTCSESELAELNAWYHAFKDQESALEDDLTGHPELLKTLKYQLWNGIEEQLVEYTQPLGKQKHFIGFSGWFLRIAAVLLIGTFVGILFWKLKPSQTVSEFHTISTQKNNLSKLKLPDGTTIWVKSGSNLRYPKVFGKNSREVFLEGEAFFDVSHLEGKPFLVHTSDLTIRVLGTAFNVKSYKEQGTIETTLVRGKVQIEKENVSGKGDVILNPYEKAVYNKELKSIDILKSVDLEEVLVKDIGVPETSTNLVFDETPFTKVFDQIEQRYHVKIHLENKDNLNCKLTADLQKEGLAEILQLLEVSHQIRYRIAGNDVYITGKLCH